MIHHCPVCGRTFEVEGFCPYDGNALEPAPAAAPDAPTRVPSTGSPDGGPTLQGGPQTVPARPPTDPAATAGAGRRRAIGDSTIRAFSAASESTHALDAIRTKASEYDGLIGETLDGRYLVQKKIGEGGMGVVFAVKHAVIERPLAIKVLKREVMRDSATIRRFIQEAQAASRIGHPNIVDVTDFGTTPDGMTYSVMEYIDGTTLAKTIKHSAPLAPERAVQIAAQIARALEAAHQKGIVHRDLKPENVFLTDRDDRPDFVKIVDFGIAKVQPLEGGASSPRLTRAGAVFGTPEYMAPEQASGRGDTDHRVDVYALGVILYEMLVGTVPLRGSSPVRTIAMQMLEPIKAPSKTHPQLEIPAALEAVMLKALAKDRDERYASMGELLAALDEIAATLAPAPTVGLAPMPPGADANVAADDVATLLPDPDETAVERAQGPRRKKPKTRPLHEPEFVAGPLSLQVFEEPAEPPPRVGPARKLLLPLLLLFAGGGAGALLLLGRGGDDTPPHAAVARDAAPPEDATAIAEVPADADADAEPPPDATAFAGVAGGDAGAHASATGPDVGKPHLHTAPPGVHPETVTVQILTRPGDANVFHGHTFRGPSGVRLTEKWGTRLDLECRAPHLKGKVRVVFDGSRTAVMCTATRIKMCVDGIMNPFDECEPRDGKTAEGPVTSPQP